MSMYYTHFLLSITYKPNAILLIKFRYNLTKRLLCRFIVKPLGLFPPRVKTQGGFL